MRAVTAVPLTKEAFGPFGSVVSPDSEVENLTSSQRNANQGTAIKILKISELDNTFPPQYGIRCSNCNLFRCFPQPHLKQCFRDGSPTTIFHDIKVLEKHPFSTQTFIPMGRSVDSGYAYLVVTALENNDKNGPDLETLQAFLCKANQAVTYGVGVWHAPMIVVGNYDHLDFTVIIHELLDQDHPEMDLDERSYKDEISIQLNV